MFCRAWRPSAARRGSCCRAFLLELLPGLFWRGGLLWLPVLAAFGAAAGFERFDFLGHLRSGGAVRLRPCLPAGGFAPALTEEETMYLSIGRDQLVPERRIVGIFDLDKASYGKRTREYLRRAEEDGVVLDLSDDLPRSFVVCDHPYHPQIVYLSQLNAVTLQKRAESGQLEV